MFETPYQTTPCSRFDMKKQEAGVRQLEIHGRLINTPVPGVMMVPPGVDDFPPFQQPLTKKEQPTLEADIVIDGRPLLRVSGGPVKEDIYNHHVLVGQLTQMWMKGETSIRRDFLQASEFTPKVFLNWVSGQVGLRLSLDFGQMTLFKALLAIYYIQLHTPLTENSNQDDKDRIVTRAARYLPGIDALTLSTTVGELRPLKTLQDFVDWTKLVMNNPRMDQLSVAFMYSALIYTWGPQFREAVAISLEYPPMFMALVYTVCLQRSYTKTGLGKVIERTIYQNSDREYVKNINHLLGRGAGVSMTGR